jgi:MFS family permease
VTVGLFFSLKDLLDGLYQYPGGWMGDRFGRKRALTLFYVSGGEGFISIFTQLGAGKYQPVAKIPTAARARFALCSRARTTLFGRSSSQ